MDSVEHYWRTQVTALVFCLFVAKGVPLFPFEDRMNVHWSVLKTGVEPNVPQKAAIVQHICGMSNQLLSLFLTLKNPNCAVRGVGVAIWWSLLCGLHLLRYVLH